jgi:hypothetical protein
LIVIKTGRRHGIDIHFFPGRRPSPPPCSIKPTREPLRLPLHSPTLSHPPRPHTRHRTGDPPQPEARSPPRSPPSLHLHRQKAPLELRIEVRNSHPSKSKRSRVSTAAPRSPNLGRPPWCLLCRLASWRKWLCESLMCSSSFWYSPRRVWCTGGHVHVSSASLRRTTTPLTHVLGRPIASGWP